MDHTNALHFETIMALDFWAKTSGTWINILTVLLGTSVGITLGSRLPKQMQQIITQGVGLLTLWLGVTMAGRFTDAPAGRIDGAIVGLLAMAIGGLLGEWLQIEERLSHLGDWLKKWFNGQGRFTEGFVATSLLFCVGPMALVGSLNNGLTGDSTLLVLKAAMDGLASIAFASSYGIGVGFSTIVLFIYQGGLSLAAGLLAGVLDDPANDPRVFLVTGIGGLMIIGIGLNLLEIARIRVGSFLPAILLAPLLHLLATRLTAG
jgi:uncharacterized membrane protein YqgA involved in biofilm formation